MAFLLHHLLEQSAIQFPDKTAVSCLSESISYCKLNDLANRLANVLKKNGIKRGDRVGIYLNKSIQSIISIFGILKAGAAYVPLDPMVPLSRVSYIVQNCEISCLLSSSNKIHAITKLVQEQHAIKFVILADDIPYDTRQTDIRFIEWRTVKSGNNTLEDHGSSIDRDLAYILYTSGSSGFPKGVMISHLNSLTFLHWVQSTFNFDSKDIISNHAPLHFDISILDIFGAIQAGATLALVPEFLSTFPMKLVEWIDDNKISVWYSVPSILIMMLLHGSITRYGFKNLRLIIFAGEVFPAKHLSSLGAEFPNVEFYNLYGPTETNVITYYKVDNADLKRELPVPIGRACSNMEVFALQENGELVKTPGVEGELYARGSSIAMGYWNDPGKTSENFIQNPVQTGYPERAYKTGDIVTVNENGDYLFRGRRDEMIKSRGYRIEIGEIENALYTVPAVKELAVVAIPDALIGNRIKAFIVPYSGCDSDAAALMKYCAERLPRYMVPEEIEFCTSLPKTPTGKTDKLELSMRNQRN